MSSDKIKARIRALKLVGTPYREIIEMFGVGRSTIQRYTRDIKSPLATQKHFLPSSAKKMSIQKARLIADYFGEGEGIERSEGRMRSGRTKSHTELKDVRKKYVVLFNNTDPKLIDRHRKDLKSVYGVSGKYNKKKQRVEVYSKEILNDLRNHGVFNKRSGVPSEITNGSNSVKRAFIGAFFDGEGHIDLNKREVRFTNSNLKLLEDVKLMLKSLVVDSRINGPYNGCFRLIVGKRDDFFKFTRIFRQSTVKLRAWEIQGNGDKLAE